MNNILKNLNEAQRAAVENFRTPSLIVAGAGSGKTRVLTSRIAYMLASGVQPWRVLALTFTNKAAAEMRARIAKVVGEEQSRRLWMGTFHSIFLKILRVEAEHIGYPGSFTIYDTQDSRNLIKTITREINLSDDAYKPAAVLSRISLAKNNLITAGAYSANTTYVAEDRQRKQPAFADIYSEYARRCRQNGAMDFDDMLLFTNILFKDHPEVLAKWQERFDYILVDEYQDTNYAQYIIIRRLAEKHSRVCVVGDDSQSIYSFRGAKIENILRFKNDFPTAQTFKLEQNYRSTQNIVGAANSVIERNANRLPKESFSEGAQGERIKVLAAYTDRDEAYAIGDEIRNRVRAGAAHSDIAILYRTNAQSRAFEDALRRRAIPYRIYGGMSFYQRKEVKDVLAYMRLIVNPADDEAFRRVVNYPARGIGDVTIARLAEAAQAAGTGLFDAARHGIADVNAPTKKRLQDFTELVSGFRFGEGTLYDFGLSVATGSGIIGVSRAENTPEAQSAIDNIEELLNSMRTFAPAIRERFDEETGEFIETPEQPDVTPDASREMLIEWLQSIALITDQDNESDGEQVTLMTIHSAKGLEYDYVYIVGMEEGLFPSQRSVGSASDLEEERRLFYVAITRAKVAAALSHCASRFKWGSVEPCNPSRFLKEIDPRFLDIPEPKEDASAIVSLSGAKNPAERKFSPGSFANAQDDNNMSPRFKKVGERPATASATSSVTYPAATSASRPVAASGNFAAGQRVAHAKFGIGTITEVENTGVDTKVTVDFDDAGSRTLLTKFARLAVVG